MKRAILVAGFAFIAAVGSTATALGGSMGRGADQRLTASIRTCLAMPHDQMMKDQGCQWLMAKYPEKFPGVGGTTGGATGH